MSETKINNRMENEAKTAVENRTRAVDRRLQQEVDDLAALPHAYKASAPL